MYQQNKRQKVCVNMYLNHCVFSICIFIRVMKFYKKVKDKAYYFNEKKMDKGSFLIMLCEKEILLAHKKLSILVLQHLFIQPIIQFKKSFWKEIFNHDISSIIFNHHDKFIQFTNILMCKILFKLDIFEIQVFVIFYFCL